LLLVLEARELQPLVALAKSVTTGSLLTSLMVLTELLVVVLVLVGAELTQMLVVLVVVVLGVSPRLRVSLDREIPVDWVAETFTTLVEVAVVLEQLV
jgi:hypothetical protein